MEYLGAYIYTSTHTHKISGLSREVKCLIYDTRSFLENWIRPARRVGKKPDYFKPK